MRRRLFRSGGAPVRDGLDVGALAPMVDMMTLLLVFLLRTWSTESAPRPPEGAFTLAGTTSVDARAPATQILVSTDGVWVDAHRVTAVAALADPAAEVVVREIYDPLLQARQKDRVEIHADAAVNYGVLKRVVATAQAAGFHEVALVGVSAEGM